MATAQRVIRRVARSAGVSSSISPMLQSQRAADEAAIAERLKLIANKQRVIQLAAQDIENAELDLELLMKKHKIPAYSDGVLEAAFKDTFTNELKVVDPKTLFNKKGFTRDDFFSCVKVQITELAKVLAENELRDIAKITPPKKTGTKLVLKPVKTVVTTKPTTSTRGKK